MKYADLKKELLENNEVKKEYESLEPEYQLIKAIINAREEKSLSQQALSELTGIDRGDISKIENGNANPSLRTMKRLAAGLGKRLKIEMV